MQKAQNKIELVKNALLEELLIGRETNEGFNTKTRNFRYKTRTIRQGDFCTKHDLSLSQFFGILDKLKESASIIDYSPVPLYSSVTPLIESGEYATKIRFPLSVEGKILNADSKEDIFAQITHSDRREIVYNDKYILARPRFNSSNDQFFQYVYNNPNRIITTKELGQHVKPYSGPNQILSDLGFERSLRAMFFPGATVDGVFFRNPITKEQFDALNIKSKKLGSDLFALKKKRK